MAREKRKATLTQTQQNWNRVVWFLCWTNPAAQKLTVVYYIELNGEARIFFTTEQGGRVIPYKMDKEGGRAYTIPLDKGDRFS